MIILFDERIDSALLGMKLLDYRIEDILMRGAKYKTIKLNNKSNILYYHALFIRNDHIKIVIEPYGTDFIGRKLMDRYDFNSFSLQKKRSGIDKQESYDLNLYGDIDSIIKMMVEFDDILPQFTSMVNRMMF